MIEEKGNITWEKLDLIEKFNKLRLGNHYQLLVELYERITNNKYCSSMGDVKELIKKQLKCDEKFTVKEEELHDFVQQYIGKFVDFGVPKVDYIDKDNNRVTKQNKNTDDQPLVVEQGLFGLSEEDVKLDKLEDTSLEGTFDDIYLISAFKTFNKKQTINVFKKLIKDKTLNKYVLFDTTINKIRKYIYVQEIYDQVYSLLKEYLEITDNKYEVYNDYMIVQGYIKYYKRVLFTHINIDNETIFLNFTKVLSNIKDVIKSKRICSYIYDQLDNITKSFNKNQDKNKDLFVDLLANIRRMLNVELIYDMFNTPQVPLCLEEVESIYKSVILKQNKDLSELKNNRKEIQDNLIKDLSYIDLLKISNDDCQFKNKHNITNIYDNVSQFVKRDVINGYFLVKHGYYPNIPLLYIYEDDKECDVFNIPQHLDEKLIQTSITVKFDLNGVHQWKGCNLDNVDFLRDIHRHLFNFNIELTVNHDDREIEFIDIQSIIINFLDQRYSNYKNLVCKDFGNSSCEMIGKEILSFLLKKYGSNRIYNISVGEDNTFFGNIKFKK